MKRAPKNTDVQPRNIEDELRFASLQSHERHMRHIYGLRWGALGLSALTISIGAAMIFAGLQGSLNWVVEAPNTIGAKLTNASPGIVFATIGMILGFIAVLQKPVNYSTGTRPSRTVPNQRYMVARLRGASDEDARRIAGLSATGPIPDEVNDDDDDDEFSITVPTRRRRKPHS